MNRIMNRTMLVATFVSLLLLSAHEVTSADEMVLISEPVELKTDFPREVTYETKVDADWSPPDRFVNMDDIQAAIHTYEGTPGAPHWTWVDVEGEIPNTVVNMGDVQFIIFAFEGSMYPFSAPADCP